jgi:hypothetical protein
MHMKISTNNIGVCNLGIEYSNFSKIGHTWRWQYAAETCSEEEGWEDNKFHLRQEYICTKDILIQQSA